MYDVGPITAAAIGAQLAIHARGELGVLRENIATNIATMAQMAKLLIYAGQSNAPASGGSPRQTAAMRSGSAMQKTPTVASSHAPIRAVGSSGRLKRMRKAKPSVTSWTVRTASSISADCVCQNVHGTRPS